MRKTYGNTWWGKEWLNALSEIDYSNRLPRGRTYANKGAAENIEIHKNVITAEVKGSQYRPYKVKFTVPKFDGATKAAIISLITENPLHLSKLLNRQLPAELNKACQGKEIYIFPHSWNDLEGSCSCPDWAVPCKHMAAVLYLVANEIDKNPFLVFQLHDFDLFKGLEGIGYSFESDQEVPILSVDSEWEQFSYEKELLEWKPDVFEQLDFSSLPFCKDNLLAILGDQPVFYPNGDFKKILNKVYQHLSRNILKKEEIVPNWDVIRQMDTLEEIELLVDEEMDFVNCTFRDSKGKSIATFDQLEGLIDWLKQVPISKLEFLSPDLRGLYLSYLFAQKLVAHSAFIPQLFSLGVKRHKVRWIPALLNEEINKRFRQLLDLVPTGILFRKKEKELLVETLSENHLLHLIGVFLNEMVHRGHGLNVRQLEHNVLQLFFNGTIERFFEYEELGYAGAIQLWLNKFFMVDKDFVPVLVVTEEEGIFAVDIAVENKGEDLKTPVPLKKVLTLKKYQKIRIPILRDLAMLSDYFPKINDLVASGGTETLYFDADDFVEVLFKILPTIRLFGIKVLLPKALRKLMRPQASMSLESAGDDGAVAKSGVISMENLLNFHWQVALGDQMYSEADFLKMVKQYSGIVKLNDQYVFFDEKEIKSLIEKLENPPTIKSNQLLQVALTEEYEGAKVNLNKEAKALIHQLLEGEETAIPDGLQATLRPYQLRGYEWLYKNARLGFGSLIADDMGLGKTLQVIATLLKLKEDGALGKKKAMVIVPTTLLTNWEKEIAKFAPSLTTHIYHGPSRSLEGLETAEVLITTYGVVRSETAKIQKVNCLVIAIDEAQNIKNPSTAQTKAVKKIKAPIKIAMSGTPVENRLSEYWSIFDFVNKNYLGNLSKFKEHYARPIEIDRDQEKLKHFRKVTEPFILRRLKSDKTIIQDLPDKIEQDQFCTLTPEQVALYESVVETTLKTIAKAEGINRKGLVLKLITALKQICNHPTQFLKKGKVEAILSGKSKLLLDLLHQILDNGEKTLIFTQYKEMGKMLVEMLEAEFGLTIPFLHGGLSRKQRDEMVNDLQNNRSTRIFILSLKAGGTGLNLTAASNVIHYDLWWNPAVEAQATDRAYRIGQKRKVMVHRFITENTFEEKINKLLQSKKELADLAVSTGEKWIGDMSTKELKDLVKLG